MFTFVYSDGYSAFIPIKDGIYNIFRNIAHKRTYYSDLQKILEKDFDNIYVTRYLIDEKVYYHLSILDNVISYDGYTIKLHEIQSSPMLRQTLREYLEEFVVINL